MSDFHILDQADDQKTVNVIWHIPVPDVNNAVGVSYRTALVGFLTGNGDTIGSQVADPTELTQMQAGEVYEIVYPIRFSRLGLSDAEKLAEIQAFYTAGSAAKLIQLQNQLKYWGYQGDVS